MSTRRLRFLGTGDSESMRFWNTNLLLESEGRRLLIDCGYTVKYALRDVGLTLADIDAIMITHVHADHAFGLERAGYETRYTLGRRIPLILEPDILPALWEHTLKGSMGLSSDGENRLEDFFDVQPVVGHCFEFAGCALRTFPTEHTPGMATYGLIFDDDVIFTADSKPLDWLAADRSARRILHDCSLQSWNPVHATLGELIEAYPRTVRERLLAIHYGDTLEAHRGLIERELGGVADQGGEIAWG
ncbi:MBL fold metallo-hydrolase [Acidihalobacter yilgarnensis]|nr:MBL fold metallo-hydrolase [Acidihalobacter yilgarnensis]